MNIFKALFGGHTETTEEKKKADEQRNFDLFKYDGIKALKTGQFEYAVRCLTKVLEIREDLEAREQLAQALLRNGELLPAYEQLQIVAEEQPDNQAIFIQMARVAYMMEDYQAMATACEKALVIDDKNSLVNFLYAQACKGQGDLINTIAMLTKAITLDEHNGDAWLLRAQTLLQMGDANGANDDCQHLLDALPDNEDVLIVKARIEYALGHADEAISFYSKVIDQNPFSIEAYRERGQVKYDKGDMEGAKEDMQKVLELDPKQVEDINGEYSAEGIEHKVKQAYNNINPYGINW